MHEGTAQLHDAIHIYIYIWCLLYIYIYICGASYITASPNLMTILAFYIKLIETFPMWML